jgi:hypothetical protein
MKVVFVGKVGGDGECFRWEGVPIVQRSGLVLHHQFDLEHGERLDTVYPGDVFDTLGCYDGRKYRFIISVEEIEPPRSVCTCHERDTSQLCRKCNSEGYFGHMQTCPHGVSDGYCQECDTTGGKE